MSEDFDPYYKWLGIPPSEQPPNHYRLLGIPLFEADRDVIRHAAEQRMSFLKSFSSGPHSRLSQRLLNEVSAAKVCLLSDEDKRAYDAQLKRSKQSNEPPPVKDGSDQSNDFAIDLAEFSSGAPPARRTTHYVTRNSPSSLSLWRHLLVALSLFVVGLIVGAIVFADGGSRDDGVTNANLKRDNRVLAKRVEELESLLADLGQSDDMSAENIRRGCPGRS